MKHPELERLISIVQKLRHPTQGCPWDLKQTHKSLLKYLLEESYEFFDAVDNDNTEQMKDEIGDVLLQVLLHAVIAEENKSFNLEDVAKNLADKLIRRHPHVFQEKNNTLTPDDVKNNWDKIKKTEHPQKQEYLIDKKQLAFPALFASNRIGEKTHTIKFDWSTWREVQDVVESEWNELKDELNAPSLSLERVQDEIGDLLFSIAQLARHLKIHPEEALRHANRKFIRRFQSMQDLIQSENRDILSMNQTEMDIYWSRIKQLEKDLDAND